MRLIPAIDIIDGQCVRLTKGDYSTKKVYNENPLEVAKMFQDSGIEYLHLVDLDGAKAKHIVNYKKPSPLDCKDQMFFNSCTIKGSEDIPEKLQQIVKKIKV